MVYQTKGIHHITAFAGSTQANVDFYAGILGLRLVKKTVNFDAPEVYHLYFGDHVGSPGTAMTFFPRDGASAGHVGGGQVGYTTFVIPPETMPFWEDRLTAFAIPFERSIRFGETYIRFQDTDGLLLEIVEREEGPTSAWSFSGISAEKAIKGFGGAVLYSTNPAATMEVLSEVMGLERFAEDDGLVRFKAPGPLGNYIDINDRPMDRGQWGAGTVHHIAWRVGDRAAQERWRSHVSDAGFRVTPILDRNYFTSIYFRERGEILFEIATDEPGFTVDEPMAALGERIMLPSWLEGQRKEIEARLPPIEVRLHDAGSNR